MSETSNPELFTGVVVEDVVFNVSVVVEVVGGVEVIVILVDSVIWETTETTITIPINEMYHNIDVNPHNRRPKLPTNTQKVSSKELKK